MRRQCLLSNEKIFHEEFVGEDRATLLSPLLVAQGVLQLPGVEGVEGLVDADVVGLHRHLIGQGLALVQRDLVLARHYF